MIISSSFLRKKESLRVKKWEKIILMIVIIRTNTNKIFRETINRNKKKRSYLDSKAKKIKIAHLYTNEE